MVTIRSRLVTKSHSLNPGKNDFCRTCVSQELSSCLVYYLAVVKIAAVGGQKQRKIVNAVVCVACPRYYRYHFLIFLFSNEQKQL